MKTQLILLLTLACGSLAQAQNPQAQRTQVEVSLGFSLPNLQGGQELNRAQALRANGQSYYADAGGNRRNVGNYPALRGFTFAIAYYKPVPALTGLMLGATVRNTQTGSQPATGGYAEGYYFNFITAGVAAKYYPFTKNNLFVKGDFGLSSVLTKNRFVNSAGEQNFFHQFGIGPGGSLGLGYGFALSGTSQKTIEIQATYQQLSTRVEVNGIGDDPWRFGALSLSAAINF